MGDSSNSKKLTAVEEIKAFLIERLTPLYGTSHFGDLLSHLLRNMATRPMRDQFSTLGHYNEKTAWMVRELCRMATGAYQRMAFSPINKDEVILVNRLTGQWQHFVHMSKDDPLYIAYTPDEAYGLQDRRVKTTPGRYLKKYYPELSDADVRKMTDAFRARFNGNDVLFASTAAEIYKVYTEGPHSCMANKFDLVNNPDGTNATFGSHMHPTAAYETPGVACAYLMRGNKINARCMVYVNPENEDDKRLIRVYGDELLRHKLEFMGFKLGNFEGVPMKKIPAQHVDGRLLPTTWVMPYIDDQLGVGAQYVTEEEHVMRVVRNLRDAPDKRWPTSAGGLCGLNFEYKRRNPNFRIKGLPAKIINCSDCGTQVDEAETRFSQYRNAHICPDCCKHWVSAQASDTVVFVKRTDVIEADGAYFLNDEATIQAHKLVQLEPAYYKGATPAGIWSMEKRTARTFDGKIILKADTFGDSTGKFGWGKNTLTSRWDVTLFVDCPYTHDDLADIHCVLEEHVLAAKIRNPDYTTISLGALFTSIATNVDPAARREALTHKLSSEHTGVIKGIHHIMEQFIARWHPDLVRSAAQIPLIA